MAARHGCFWTSSTNTAIISRRRVFAYLCERAGFVVAQQRLVFGGQYQLLELKVRRAASAHRRFSRSARPAGAFARRAETALRPHGNAACPPRRPRKAGGLGRGKPRAWRWSTGSGDCRRDFVIDSNTAKQAASFPARACLSFHQTTRVSRGLTLIPCKPEFTRRKSFSPCGREALPHHSYGLISCESLVRITIDTGARTILCEDQSGRRTLPLYSDDAFEVLSHLWLKVGWNQKYSTLFPGLAAPLIQLPEDVLRIQEVLWRVKPDVILETGVAHGGSLLLYATLCEAMERPRDRH